MNENKVNEESSISPFNAALNYVLNKFMPLILVCFILFYTIGFNSVVPYLVIGFFIFSNKYSFLCGYADAVLVNEMKLDTNEKDTYLSKDEY